MKPAPEVLRHATRRSTLGAILREGLRTAHYGAVHGAMEYAPAGPSVYLSRHLASNNLNTALFDQGAGEVVVIDIDASALDPDLIYPDEALFPLMDEAFLPEEDADEDEHAECVALFADHFGIPEDRAAAYIDACVKAGFDETEYPRILKDLWQEYLAVEGEIAYLGDVPAEAILGWRTYAEAEALIETQTDDPRPFG